MIVLKSMEEVELMRKAGRLAAQALKLVGESVRVGVSTKELDGIAERFIRAHGGKPSFKGYRGFPGSICASVNEQVVHGIPSSRKLHEGDIISIDMGVELNGFHGDTAKTFAVGKISEEAQRLIDVTEKSFYEGLKFAISGNRVGDISHAVQSTAEHAGYSVVRELVGHGVGRNLHESPDIPNFGEAGHGIRLREGMTIAIEPMINMGKAGVYMLDDDWTVVTADTKYSSHYEHTVAIMEGRTEILTKCD